MRGLMRRDEKLGDRDVHAARDAYVVWCVVRVEGGGGNTQRQREEEEEEQDGLWGGHGRDPGQSKG